MKVAFWPTATLAISASARVTVASIAARSVMTMADELEEENCSRNRLSCEAPLADELLKTCFQGVPVANVEGGDGAIHRCGDRRSAAVSLACWRASLAESTGSWRR